MSVESAAIAGFRAEIEKEESRRRGGSAGKGRKKKGKKRERKAKAIIPSGRFLHSRTKNETERRQGALAA